MIVEIHQHVGDQQEAVAAHGVQTVAGVGGGPGGQGGQEQQGHCQKAAQHGGGILSLEWESLSAARAPLAEITASIARGRSPHGRCRHFLRE
ncbi:hypothetical protein D3C78_1542850 [compost metagenome]